MCFTNFHVSKDKYKLSGKVSTRKFYVKFKTHTIVQKRLECNDCIKS